MTTDKILQEIQEWAESSSAYLSDKCEYSKGYKNGIIQAKEIVKDILSQSEEKANK